MIYLYELGTKEERVKDFHVTEGPWALWKVIEVPNKRKNRNEYVIEYDGEHDNTEGWVTHFPRTAFVQEQLRDAVERADRYNWRMGV